MSVEVGMAVGEVVGSSAEIISDNNLRHCSISNALQAQGVDCNIPQMSPTCLAYNTSSVGGASGGVSTKLPDLTASPRMTV